MTGIGIAASSGIAAEAGSRVADEGGNAVDAAIAAVLVSLVTEPSVCSLGGGAFVTVDPPAQPTVTIDGYVEMPGRGLAPERFGQGVRDVHIKYGGGVETTVGHGSIATPGALAGFGLASKAYGKLPWARVVEPAYDWARSGFPLSRTSRLYLEFCGEEIFGWHPESRAVLYGPDDRLAEAGDPIRIPDLADSLERIARAGAQDLYRGELARMIAREIEGHGGILTLRDLGAYEPVVRTPAEVRLGRWTLATNPPPAIGGCSLAAMLALIGDGPRTGWSAAGVREIVHAQQTVLEYRAERLDTAEDLAGETRRLLESAAQGVLGNRVRSGSTVHASAVDTTGLACSITASAGYGSGVMPSGTGIWMNNSLGEQELTRRGLHAQPPGTRLPSNMAPTVGHDGSGAVLSLGSPGADRITTALFQTIVNFINLDMPLGAAVAQPRIHVERDGETVRAACELGVAVGEVDLPVREFDGLHMYFGGVGAALYTPGQGFTLAADPRRDGATAIGGSRV